MKDELYASARQFGQTGLRAYLDRNWLVFLLHAATSLEILSKSFLASKHPSLIAAPDMDSLFHACGLSAHAHKPVQLMKTIHINEALDRCGRLIPPLANLIPELSLLVEVRNGVAHLGRADEVTGKRALLPFLRASDFLLTNLGATATDFWGGMAEFVGARLSNSIKEAELRTTEAITAARLEFERRYGGITDAAVRDAVLKGIERTYTPEKYEEHLVDCPACLRLALAHGAYEVRWEPEYDSAGGEGYVAGVYPVVTFYPSGLQCNICGLELYSDDEIQAAGIELSWELEDVDPDDFYEGEDY